MKAEDNLFPSVLFAEQVSAPATPAAGGWRTFFKSDGLYVIDDAGTETGPLAIAGGGGGGGAGWPPPGFATGTYYSNPWATGSGTKTLTAGALEIVPFPVPYACTIDQLAAEVLTSGGGGLVRMGIYNSNASHLPGSLLLDAGTVTSAATGIRGITISQALTPGIYWLAALVDAAGGTWRTWTGVNSQPLGWTTGGGANVRYVATGVATGALPSTLPALTLDQSAVFRVLARAA